jgi:hypothetical protein
MLRVAVRLQHVEVLAHRDVAQRRRLTHEPAVLGVRRQQPVEKLVAQPEPEELGGDRRRACRSQLLSRRVVNQYQVAHARFFGSFGHDLPAWREYGSDRFDMPSRVHLLMQNAKRRHSLDGNTVVDDVLLNGVGAEVRSDLVS